MKSLPPLNTIIMTCFNNVPRGLGPWSMLHGFSFHWSQLGVQVSHLPLLYLHPSVVLLFTYLGLYNAAAASLRLCVCGGTKRICAHCAELPARNFHGHEPLCAPTSGTEKWAAEDEQLGLFETRWIFKVLMPWSCWYFCSCPGGQLKAGLLPSYHTHLQLK